MKFTTIYFIILFLFGANLQAQITITSDDLPMEGTQLAISNQAAPMVDLLNADETNAQTWNWSTLVNEEATAVVFDSPVGTPAASDFNTADFIRNGTLGSLFGAGFGNFDVPTTAYYQEGNDGNVYFEGAAINLGLDSLGLDLLLLETEEDLYRAFSTGAIGESYSTDGAYFTDIDISALGLDIPVISFLRLTLDLETDVTMDAFGEMILPDSTYEVLRYNENTTTNIRLAPWGELGGFEFEIPIETLPIPDSLAFIQAIFIDTMVSSKTYRFYTNGLDYPVANANVLETDTAEVITTVEYYTNPPILSAAIMVLDTLGQCGQVFLSAEATGASLSYEWDFGDGDTANFGNTLHAYDSNGTYEVILVVTDGFGESISDTQTVTIDCPTELSFIATNAIEDCQQVLLVNNSQGLGLTYTYDFGDGNSIESDENSLTYNYEEDGIYTITLTATDATGISTTESQSIEIDCTPPPVAIFSIDNDPDSCRLYTFVNISTGSNLMYLWEFGDGNTSTEENPTNLYLENGSYAPTLTITDEDEVETSISIDIEVDCDVLGLETLLEKNDYDLYPNPSTGLFYLELNNPLQQGITIEIIDLLGRRVLSKNTNAQDQISIDLKELPANKYYLKVISEKELLILDSIIKE